LFLFSSKTYHGTYFTIRTDKKIIYPALLYRRAFPSREEHKLQVFDNTVLRKVSESKKDERNV
jgi:hypothetical protein